MHLESSSDLDRLKMVLSSLPDEELVCALERRRGHGRDDYPVRPTWNALIAGIVYNHSTISSLRRELLRNGELRQICGFDPMKGSSAVPSESALSRFVAALIDQESLIEEMFHDLVESLKKELPDLGMNLAVDSKAIPSHGNPVKEEKRNGVRDERRDVDADWGSKKYKGVRKDGTAWEKVKHWFGYKLHLLVDSVYEMPLAYAITTASTSDAKHLLPLVEDRKERHADIAQQTNAPRTRSQNISVFCARSILPGVVSRRSNTFSILPPRA